MIFSIFIVVGASMVAAVVSLLPTSSGLSSSIITQIEGLATSVYVLNEIVAIDALWTSLVIIFAYELILLGFTTVRWFIRMTPLVGNRV